MKPEPHTDRHPQSHTDRPTSPQPPSMEDSNISLKEVNAEPPSSSLTSPNPTSPSLSSHTKEHGTERGGEGAAANLKRLASGLPDFLDHWVRDPKNNLGKAAPVREPAVAQASATEEPASSSQQIPTARREERSDDDQAALEIPQEISPASPSPLPVTSSDSIAAQPKADQAQIDNPKATHSYIDELELLREDYYDLLSDLHEQAQELQREENKNFFATFFKQQQETSPVTKNIFFELLEQAHADGHTYGDYDQILTAAREYSQQLVGNSLKQLTPAQLATLLGEASVNDLTTYLSSQKTEQPALVADMPYRTDQGAEDIIL